MKKTKNKILSGLLALAMAVGVLPMAQTTTHAASSDRAMAFGMNGIQNWDKNGSLTIEQTDKIVMGTYGGSIVEWVQLNDDGLMFATRSVSTQIFGTGRNIYYPGSALNEEMKNLYSYDDEAGVGSLELTATEKKAIASTSLAASSMHKFVESNLDNQKFFPLSETVDGGGEFHEYVGVGTELANGEGSSSWWSRSSYDNVNAISIITNGGVKAEPTQHYRGLRPAFNLNLGSVLFTSGAVDGKSGTVGSFTDLRALTAPTTWKMTLLDSARTFALTGELRVTENTVEFDYENAKTGINEYISVMIVDNSNNVTHYGKIEDLSSSASGTASFAVPTGITGDVRLRIFNEQDNGDNETDYSSAFIEKTVLIADAPTYGISLTPSTDYVFPTTEVGYNEQDGYDVTVTNIGNQATGDLTLELSGANKDDFSINYAKLMSLTIAGGRAGFTVKPMEGLVAGTYTATVTVSNASNNISESFDISFTVNSVNHNMVEGSDQIITQGQTGSFTSDAEHVNLKEVKVDDKTLQKGTDYTDAPGSTIITLLGSYTSTLTPGVHTLEIVSTTGAATTQFTITVPPSPTPAPSNPDTAPSNGGIPQTGDDNHILWYLFVILISFMGIGVIVYRKKVQNR